MGYLYNSIVILFVNYFLQIYFEKIFITVKNSAFSHNYANISS